MDNFLISLPYMYPVCPVSIDHARLFVIADIIARYHRETHNVLFPIAAHYSGVTADIIMDKIGKQNQETINLYVNYYKMPKNDLERIKSSVELLDYYSEQMLNNLRELQISCEYEHFYKTNSNKYEIFVKIMFEQYLKQNMIISNDSNELALNFNNTHWRYNTREFISSMEFIQKFHKKNILGSFDTLTDDFGFIRPYGIGTYYAANQIIDPMFDGDFFMLFDSITREINIDDYSDALFATLVENIFKAASGISHENDIVIDRILSWLPCDVFVCEEHLKTWIVKKAFSEVLLLKPEYRTKKYFITGLGSRNNKRMSSSRGNAVLLKDLLEQHGSIKARMLILLCGGHPSKNYHYDEELIKTVDNMINKFGKYYYKNLLGINTRSNYLIRALEIEENTIKRYIEEGYYGQAINTLMIGIPSTYKNNPNYIVREDISYLCEKYLEILLPGITEYIRGVWDGERI